MKKDPVFFLEIAASHKLDLNLEWLPIAPLLNLPLVHLEKVIIKLNQDSTEITSYLNIAVFFAIPVLLTLTISYYF